MRCGEPIVKRLFFDRAVDAPGCVLAGISVTRSENSLHLSGMEKIESPQPFTSQKSRPVSRSN